MKIAEFELNNGKIEFENSIFGKETVLINGKIASEKYSISGTEHKFKIESNNFSLTSEYRQFTNGKTKIELFKNGKLIDSKNEQNIKQSIYWKIMGALLGIIIYRIISGIYQ